MQTLIYDERMFNNDGTMSGGWGDFLGQIGAAGVSLLPSLFGGGGGGANGQAKGLQAITAFGQQAIQTLGQILQQLQGGQLSPSDAISNAQRIVSALSDPAYVYQAKRGKDAEALAGFKQQAGQMMSQIQAAASAVTVDPKTGMPNAASPAQSSGMLGGIDTGMLLMLGGGLALLLLLTRR